MTGNVEYKRTAPFEQPPGEGWTVFHSGCSPDGSRFWVWVRATS